MCKNDEHEFVSLLKSQKPATDKINIEISDVNRTTINLQQLADALITKEYTIICKKCGKIIN